MATLRTGGSARESQTGATDERGLPDMTERERAAFLLVIDLLIASDGYTTGMEREGLRKRLRVMRPSLEEPDFVDDTIVTLEARALAL